MPLADLLVRCGLAKSKGEARRLIAGGGVYVNEERIGNPQAKLAPERLRADGSILLRTGKRNYHVVRPG